MLPGSVNITRAQSQNAVANSSKVSDELRARVINNSSNNNVVRVILQLSEPPRGQLNALLNRNGIHVRANFRNLNSMVVELPAGVVDELASFSEVSFVSLDSKTEAFGHISATTGTDAVRAQTTSTLLGGTTTTYLDGSGIGIAVIDSGIDAAHTSFLDKSNNVRVVVNRDFTGEGRTDDPYGHGTHVAATAAGNGRISNAAYIGIAPNAKLINLRVLDRNGVGKTSSLLSAIDWVLANRTTYNIRVVNMSLGGVAVDSYKNDPVCKAVRKLVDAGIVAVAAAGNNGKNSSGQKLYGHIHSPGNEPSAITVGASNTFGTDVRSDDAVTTYRS
ncbi:MAG TPA: S8 family serine peptidase, partial [Pyrinomonadaceae bacterium]|nr:S8 family serine peptidase [Pyrinomonadaceae bacterium]